MADRTKRVGECAEAIISAAERIILEHFPEVDQPERSANWPLGRFATAVRQFVEITYGRMPKSK